MPCVKKLKTVQNRARNSKFTWIGLLGQERADVLKTAIFGQNSLRNYELIEISVFCQKRKTTTSWQNILTV